MITDLDAVQDGQALASQRVCLSSDECRTRLGPEQKPLGQALAARLWLHGIRMIIQLPGGVSDSS